MNEQELIEIYPYLDKLIDSKPNFKTIINMRDKILSNFDSMAVTERDLLIEIDNTDKVIGEDMEKFNLKESIPIESNVKARRMLFNNKEKQIELVMKCYMDLANEYEELIQRKEKVIRVPIVKDISKEDKIQFKEQIKDDVKWFFDSMKKKKVLETKLKLAKKKFTDDMMEEYKGIDIPSDIKIKILEETMYEYENKD